MQQVSWRQFLQCVSSVSGGLATLFAPCSVCKVHFSLGWWRWIIIEEAAFSLLLLGASHACVLSVSGFSLLLNSSRCDSGSAPETRQNCVLLGLYFCASRLELKNLLCVGFC